MRTWEALADGLLANDAFMARRLQATPLRRIGEPHEVAGLAVLLASAVTGQAVWESANPVSMTHRSLIFGGTLACGGDVDIDVGCIFEGRVVLGDGVRIGANCVIRDARIEAGAVSVMPSRFA